MQNNSSNDASLLAALRARFPHLVGRPDDYLRGVADGLCELASEPSVPPAFVVRDDGYVSVREPMAVIAARRTAVSLAGALPRLRGAA